MRVNSLTTRFVVAFLVCATLPFVVFALYVRSEVRRREETQVVSYLPKWADDAARRIATHLETASRVGWTLASEAETYLRNDSRAFEEHVLSLFQVNPDFDMVILADARGDVVEVMRRPALDEQRREELMLLEPKSVAETQWFRDINTRVHARWVPRHASPYLHRNPRRVQSKDPLDYSLGVGFQVQTQAGFGALFILLRWEQVQQVLDETTRFLAEKAGLPSAELFLCDAEGLVLAHSDRARYGEDLLPNQLGREVLRRRSGHAFIRDESGTELGLGFASAQPYLPGEDFDWRVGLDAPVAELFAGSREFGGWLLLVIPVIGVLVVGLGILAGRAIARPVRQLADATRSVAQGDLGARVKPGGAIELRELGQAFNTMAEDLATSRDQLRDAERQAAWAEMARQVAHEIKNPLTPMRMGAQLLLRARREEDDRWQDLSERLARNVLTQTDALDRIASDFRQFAGSPARDVRRVAADDFLIGVEDLLASMAEESPVDLRFVPGAGTAEVEIDSQEMRRVFLNLIHNAMQACGDRGSVAVTSAVVGDGARVEFRFEDDGSGVPEEMRGRLFDPYFTTRTSGTGLGLAICRRIVEAHGGDIRLEEPGPPRTVFSVTLAVAARS